MHFDAAISSFSPASESFESFTNSTGTSSFDFGPFTLGASGGTDGFVANTNNSFLGGTPIQDGSTNLFINDNGNNNSITLTFNFDTPITAFALYLGDIHDVGTGPDSDGSVPNNTDLQISLDGTLAWNTVGTGLGAPITLTETISGNSSDTGNGVNTFAGFVDTDGFTTVELVVDGLVNPRSPQVENFLLDNIQFVQVPEPSTSLLAGLASLALITKRRRN